MEYATPTVERISENFLKHNPYAHEAYGGDEEPIAWALLAIAYELSQIRYQITRGNNHDR